MFPINGDKPAVKFWVLRVENREVATKIWLGEIKLVGTCENSVAETVAQLDDK